jgi:hypothetical protein
MAAGREIYFPMRRSMKLKWCVLAGNWASVRNPAKIHR